LLNAIKSAVGQNPTLRRAIVQTGTRLERSKVNGVVSDLQSQGGLIAAQLADAIKQFSDKDDDNATYWIEGIEAHRRKLLKDNSLLAPEKSDVGGIHDNNRSVRDAALVSKPPRSARLLFFLTRALKSRSIIEMGTNVGISSAYIAAGQKAASIKEPKLTTLESSPFRIEIAKRIHSNLDLGQTLFIQGDFDDNLGPALDSMRIVDLAFIDGNHKFKPTLRFTEMLLDKSDEDIVLIYDDIRWSDGMEKAWKQIEQDPRFAITLDLNTMGIAVRCAKSKGRFTSPRIYSLAA